MHAHFSLILKCSATFPKGKIDQLLQKVETARLNIEVYITTELMLPKSLGDPTGNSMNHAF